MADDSVPPQGRRLVVERVFEVDVPLERAWAVLADTQHLNQLFFGVGAMEVLERDDEKARLTGGFGLWGAEFDEYPWVFEVPRRYRTVRVFTRGIMRRLESECELEESNGKTRVRYVSTLEVAGPIAAVFGWVFRQRIWKGLDAVERVLREGATPAGVLWPPAYPHADAVRGRARAVVDGLLREAPHDAPVLERLVEHLASAPGSDVARMRPYELADLWGLPRGAVLACFLRGTRAGLLKLSWDLLCPSCENAPGRGSAKLSELPSTGHCQACDVDFSASFDRNVEATFGSAPSIRPASPALFCYGSPARTPSWIAQLVVPPGEERELTVALGAGRYRLQAAGVAGRCLLEASGAGAPRAEVTITKEAGGERPRLPGDAPALCTGSATLVVRNDDDRPRRVQLAHRAFASRAATAADVTGLGLFRDLFADDVLSREQHVEVGRAAILFTDLVGSTAMYERVGDAQAYGLVREHFCILEGLIAAEGGRVVKTIGDAVMASFDRSVDALRAAAKAVPAVEEIRDRSGATARLALKVGVHEGPCLAISANGAPDYFGRTVNVAARLQGLAGTRELVLSDAVAASPEVAELLAALEEDGAGLERERRAVKGVEGEIEIVRVRFGVVDAHAAATRVSSTLQPA